jgi:hypothetical protein
MKPIRTHLHIPICLGPRPPTPHRRLVDPRDHAIDHHHKPLRRHVITRRDLQGQFDIDLPQQLRRTQPGTRHHHQKPLEIDPPGRQHRTHLRQSIPHRITGRNELPRLRRWHRQHRPHLGNRAFQPIRPELRPRVTILGHGLTRFGDLDAVILLMQLMHQRQRLQPPDRARRDHAEIRGRHRRRTMSHHLHQRHRRQPLIISQLRRKPTGAQHRITGIRQIGNPVVVGFRTRHHGHEKNIQLATDKTRRRSSGQ